MATTRRLNREEQKQQRRERLLDAAWRLFLEHGYEALSVDMIAEQAGFTRMPVYNLFGNKQGLFVALWLDFQEKQWLRSILGGSASPATTTLAQALTVRAPALLEELESPELRALMELATLLISLSRRDPELRATIAERQQRTRDRLAQRISELVAESGEPLHDSPTQIAAAIVAHINGILLLEMLNPGGVSPDDFAAQLRRLALGGRD